MDDNEYQRYLPPQFEHLGQHPGRQQSRPPTLMGLVTVVVSLLLVFAFIAALYHMFPPS